ncbi:hypothetical protein [Streptomyces sp. NPDC003688]
MSRTTTREALMRSVMRVDAALVSAAVHAVHEQVPATPPVDLLRGHDTVLHPAGGGHFPWCEPGACNVIEDGGTQHTEHLGRAHHIVIEDGRESPLHLVAQLAQDDTASPATHVHLYEEEGNYSILDAAAAARAADRLECLARLLRTMHTAMDRPSAPTPGCPDGVLFCEGAADGHADPRERVHQGPLTAMHGSYTDDRTGLMAFQLAQWNDDAPGLDFSSDGSWPTLTLDQVDELICDMSAHLECLRAERAALDAILAGGESR